MIYYNCIKMRQEEHATGFYQALHVLYTVYFKYGFTAYAC